MVAKTGKKAGKSLSQMAGLTFPVARVGSALKKGRYAKRVSPTAAVFLAAVLEYSTTELLNSSAKAAQTTGAAKKGKKGKSEQHQIKPRHITLAVREDEELGKLLSKVTIAGGGVAGGVHKALTVTDKKHRKKSAGSSVEKKSKKKSGTKKPKKGSKSPKKSPSPKKE